MKLSPALLLLCAVVAASCRSTVNPLASDGRVGAGLGAVSPAAGPAQVGTQEATAGANSVGSAPVSDGLIEPEPGMAGTRERGAAAEAATQAAKNSVPMVKEELALWNDPGFKKRFTESYLADTNTEPPTPDEEQLLFADASELMGAGKRDKALALLEKRRKRESSAALDCYVANMYFQEERYAEALALYREAVEKFPRFKRAWGNLALSAYRLEDYPACAQATVKNLEFGGGNGDLYGLLGRCYMQMENYIAAESAYRMANLLQPDNLTWQSDMAEAFIKQNRFAEGAALIGSLIQRQPNNAKLRINRARMYLSMEATDEAAEDLKVAELMGGLDSDLMMLLGNIYINQGLSELGVEEYLNALALDPEKTASGAVTAARTVLFLANAPDDAQRLLDAVDPQLLKEDKQLERLGLLSRVAISKDPERRESVEILSQILELNPLDGDALLRLAKAYALAGETEQAMFYFDRADAIEAFEEASKREHGTYLAKLERYSEALPLLRRSLEIKRAKEQNTSSIEAYIAYVERALAASRGAK